MQSPRLVSSQRVHETCLASDERKCSRHSNHTLDSMSDMPNTSLPNVVACPLKDRCTSTGMHIEHSASHRDHLSASLGDSEADSTLDALDRSGFIAAESYEIGLGQTGVLTRYFAADNGEIVLSNIEVAPPRFQGDGMRLRIVAWDPSATGFDAFFEAGLASRATSEKGTRYFLDDAVIESCREVLLQELAGRENAMAGMRVEAANCLLQHRGVAIEWTVHLPGEFFLVSAGDIFEAFAAPLYEAVESLFFGSGTLLS